MLKKEIRNTYLKKRKHLSENERNKLDDLLLIQLQKLSLEGASVLFNYFPMEHMAEPDTLLFADYLQTFNPELAVAYPVSNFETSTMQAYEIDNHTTFEKNKYSLIEPQNGRLIPPETIDVIFVPLLAVDKKGYRVGFGKGFYDKYMVQCKTNVLKIGFSYFSPVLSIDDIHENDVSLNVLITPDQIIKFTT